MKLLSLPVKKVNVAIIVPGLKQLGPIKVMQNLVNSLSADPELKLKVFYLDFNVDPSMKFLVPVKRLKPLSFDFEEFDIIHTNGIRPDLFAWVYRRKIRYHISTIHNFVFDDLNQTYNKFISIIFGNIWLLLWKKCDRLVCLSESMKFYYRKWFHLSKLEVIYNGIPLHEISISHDDELIQACYGFKAKGLKVLGTACVLTKRKGIDQILYLLVKEKVFALIIIGDGSELQNLKRLAAKLGISDRVYFCGFKTNAISYFKNFDFFIMPSRSEGFGLALIEAVQKKVPVICSDIPVFKELFSENEISFFTLDNLNSISDAIIEATHSGLQKVELAYKRYMENYTDALMSQKYLELYLSA